MISIEDLESWVEKFDSEAEINLATWSKGSTESRPRS